MTTYTAKNAKRKPGRRRAAPRLVPAWLMMLAGLVAGPTALFLPPTYAKPTAALALVVCLAWFIQRIRYAGWAVTTSADQELKR